MEEQVGGEWNAAVGLTFSEDGQNMFVWEKGGKVWVVKNGEKAPQPLIDLTNEVGDWGDHGLLGFALDPAFANNGYIYLLYVVDRNYLMTGGTGSYDPAVTSQREATIGRVTRYKVVTRNGDLAADLGSRKVLLGETPATGIPILYESHGVGSLAFGEDGSLLISAGDGASAGLVDGGYREDDPKDMIPVDTYIPQALADGIITEAQNIGAYRSQQLSSLNGKILRIDPATGNGLPSNPFYDASKPRAASSRVWSLGLRNPFRFTVKPGSGNATSPGTIYVGDVGWLHWEEINVADKAGLNFGWPFYEGLEELPVYTNRRIDNLDAPNPLYGKGNCDMPYIAYNDLIYPPKRTEAVYFGNFCDWTVPIPADVPTFVHTRPILEWVNAVAKDGVAPTPITRTGTFDGEDAAVVNVGDADSPVTGAPFYGSSSTGGIWYFGDALPEEYRNTYFFGDYGAGWIKNLTIDGDNKPKKINNFIDENARVTAFATNPATGELYYVNYAAKIMKVAFYDGNTPPVAVAEADKLFGQSPLRVSFSAAKSTDAEGKALTYEWDFGDGSEKATGVTVQHTFTATGAKAFEVTLTVTDAEGLTDTEKLTITVNNTPPAVTIVSPTAETKYPMDAITTYQLKADVTDGEDSDAELTYEWQVALHHNTHNHPDPVMNEQEASATLTPIGCDGETYFYRVSLKVTDTGGLSASDFVDVYPDCSAGVVAAVAMASPANNAAFDINEPVELKVNFADAARQWEKIEYFQGTSLIGTVTSAPYSFTWRNVPAGVYNITAKATDISGHSVTSGAVSIAVGDGGIVELADCLPGLIHYFGFDETEGTTFDDFTSGVNATCENCPEPVEGKFLGGARFSSTATGIDIGDANSFNWGAGDSFSMGFWIKTDATPAENAVIIGRDASAAGSGLHWWIGLTPEGKAVFMLKDINHAGVQVGGEQGPKLNDGTWHHILAVRDGASNMNRLFVDGALLKEEAYQYSNGFEGQAAVNVGYLNRASGYHYSGDLDEFKVYDRAVSQAEIAGIYNGGSGTYCGLTPLGMTDNQTFAGTYEVFPNPAFGDQLHLYVSKLSPGEDVTLMLVDITGKKVLEHHTTARPDGIIQLSLSLREDIAMGLYNLLLLSEERKLNRKIVIKK
ncbi:PQQ-dependent sugar dehydrogenase [Pontibacter saemangeumensis]|uniref:PQQ-dependent sugar dehydrogenase n=1 Tax=Pontibacter saemangeumensis TaxID=1084525 RepID=UPI0031E9DE85